ncbi:hypothetical protein ACFL08_03545 [Patescibacteria group bacterium]
MFRVYKKPLPAFLGAVAGGFFIDLDHVIDYFFAFGSKLNLNQFFKGMQFLESDRMYLLFHGWEYVVLIAVIACFLKNKIFKIFLLALSLAAFVHLCTDIAINEGMSVKGYSIVYRAKSNFEIEKIVTPEHYVDHMKRKMELEN